MLDDVFIGEIKLFAGKKPPEGFMFCHGQLLNIRQNQALFSIIGISFGGDGISNFALPDMRGRCVIDEALQDSGNSGGSETVQIGIENMPAHEHGMNGKIYANFDVKAVYDSSNTNSPENANFCLADDMIYAAPGNTKYLGDPHIKMSSIVAEESGSSSPVEITPPYLALNFMIAVKGNFPSRY